MLARLRQGWMCFIIWLSCIFRSNLKLSSTINNVKFNPCLIMLSVKQTCFVYLLLSSGLCLFFFSFNVFKVSPQLLGCQKSIRKMSAAWDKSQPFNGSLLFSSIQLANNLLQCCPARLIMYSCIVRLHMFSCTLYRKHDFLFSSTFLVSRTKIVAR